LAGVKDFHAPLQNGPVRDDKRALGIFKVFFGKADLQEVHMAGSYGRLYPCRDRTEPAGPPTGNRTAPQIMSWFPTTQEGNYAARAMGDRGARAD
jgi:hypothetical protein